MMPQLTFDNQGGSGGTNSIAVTSQNTFPNIIPPISSRTGYIFDGYYTSANGQGTKIYNANGTPAVSTSQFTTDTTLYAYWQWKWYTISSVTGSTTSYTIYDDPEQSIKESGFTIYPASGHRVSAFSFDNTNWIEVKSYYEEIFDTGVAMKVGYYGTTKSNILTIEFTRILYNYSSPTPINIYLQFVSGESYPSLTKPTTSVAVSGVAVQATLGGTAYIVGDNLEALEDDDTITCAAFVTQEGYAFKHWANADGTVLSTKASERFKKSVVMGSVVTAVFEQVDSSNVNLDVEN